MYLLTRYDTEECVCYGNTVGEVLDKFEEIHDDYILLFNTDSQECLDCVISVYNFRNPNTWEIEKFNLWKSLSERT